METTSELLDDVERRVEELRDMARKLIQEQSNLSSTLTVLDRSMDEGGDNFDETFSTVDREDLKSRISQLHSRLSSVAVEVKTVRDIQQTEALGKVGEKINELITEIETGDPEALQKAQSYLDACTIGTGTKFESMVLACASDDQKSIRRKMEQLVEQVKALEQPVPMICEPGEPLNHDKAL